MVVVSLAHMYLYPLLATIRQRCQADERERNATVLAALNTRYVTEQIVEEILTES